MLERIYRYDFINFLNVFIYTVSVCISVKKNDVIFYKFGGLSLPEVITKSPITKCIMKYAVSDKLLVKHYAQKNI